MPRPVERITKFDLKLLNKFITKGEKYAIDFETQGLDATHPEFRILGIGVANSARTFYIDFIEFAPDEVRYTLALLEHCELVAHNVMFDGACFYKILGRFPNFIGCSLVLFKMVAAEGWLGQQWNLETAIDDILGWPDNNKETLKELLETHKLSKSDMWKLSTLEPVAFADYCGNDAEACWQLWHVLVGVCTKDLSPTLTWHSTPYMNEIKLLIEQQFRGIYIDASGVSRYRTKLEFQAEKTLREFFTHSKVNPHVSKFNRQVIEEHKSKEPPKLTKTGKVSVRWEAWKEKLNEMSRTNHFNVNSKQQLADLFYDQIYHSYQITNRKGDKLWVIVVDGEKLEVESTDGGSRAIDKTLLPRLGKPGQLLAEYNKILKEIQYVESCLEKVRDNILYPQFKMHGTVTGRLGGDGGFNIQQQPKTRGYLECWKARPGHKLLQLDFSAIEPVVLTNASKDPTLLKLYGSEKPNDVYLYNLAHMALFSDEVRAVYDPNNPTPESIAKAKKEFKGIRGVSKTVHLAKQYGAGTGRIFHTLTEQGYKVSWEDVKLICEDWDKLYEGTKDFETQLMKEWEHKGGYIHNMLHRPLAVASDKTKDLVNRYCQSSGHDILLLYLYFINTLRFERKVEMYPWIVDFHDETIWEVPVEYVDEANQILVDALALLNKELNLTIPVKGDTLGVSTLADIKCEG